MPRSYWAEAAPHLYLLSAGKLGEWGAGAGCDGPLSKIVRDIQIHEDSGNLVSLVDFKAGFEDLARGVVTGIDRALVVVDPTQASMALALHVRQLVEGLRAGHLPATQHLESAGLVQIANEIFRSSRLQGFSVLLNKISGKEMEQFVTEKLSTAGIEPIGTVPQDEQLSLAWLNGTLVRSEKAGTAIRFIAQQLEHRIETAGARRHQPTPTAL